MRHDFSDQIQVRYLHSNGESFDTWVSGEEVMQRLDSQARQRLIRSYGRKDWRELRDDLGKELKKGKEEIQRDFKERLAGQVRETLGDNIFGDTLADRIRGVDPDADPYEVEKELWRSRMQDAGFREIVLELAWINLEGAMPPETGQETDDWM